MRRQIRSIIGIGCLAFAAFFAAQSAAAEAVLDTQAVLAEINKQYDSVTDFTAQFSQDTFMQDSAVHIEGTIYYKAPGRFRGEFDVKTAGYAARNTTVYDGSTLWQEERSADGQDVNVAKSAVDASSPQGQIMLQQFNPRSQLQYILEQYDILGVKEENIAGRPVRILEMALNPETKERMLQLVTAHGEDTSRIPEKLVFYWDKQGGFCAKIDTLSKKNEVLSNIVYRSVKVNSGLADERFSYTPAEGTEVMDMSQALTAENAAPETEGAQNPMVGKPAPQFSLADFQGKKYDSAGLKGKVAVIDFWEHWCPPCAKELPLIEELYQEYLADEDVRVLTITQDKEKAVEFIDENGYTFPVLIDEDSTVTQGFGVDSIPRVFVIDREGKIAAVYIGYHPDIKDVLTKDIERLKQE
ncbi:MAG: redoxin domain-containing protein [Candidatus Omnitrophica bacterium]|nr:redoxin domain-containing protein [Candidatus Omnitrophota bacterium]MBU4478645.1 redoxin domain-containing protein [Candidatus Omnitrophota bacterium]